MSCKCYAAMVPAGPLVPHTIERRAVGPDDVAIDIKYAGICHSDVHQAREEWGSCIFPMVPGHEIGGFVTAVGPNVTSFKLISGDKITESYDRVVKSDVKYRFVIDTSTF
ncbi:adhC [Symbiodinium sp. KB8]|nr:adhC [Symbiodinium sp. KB8]